MVPIPPAATRTLQVRIPLDHHGETPVRTSLEVHGPSHAPVVLVLGGISAGRHLLPTPLDPSPGWWPGVVGAGAALDPRTRRLLGVEYLGGPGAPVPGPITTRDQARLLVAALDALGVDEVTVVGGSYGGMVGLTLAAEHPERVRRLVVLCAAHRPHPMATALRALQRTLARRDDPEALILARGLAMTTYRSALEFDRRFSPDPLPGGQWTLGAPEAHPAAEDAAPRFPVEDYLRSRGEAFARRFDVRAFLTLSTSIDLHRVDPRRIHTPTTLVSVESDAVIPPFLAEELAREAPGVEAHVQLRSAFGHDAFLKEVVAVGGVVREALQGREVAA